VEILKEIAAFSEVQTHAQPVLVDETAVKAHQKWVRKCCENALLRHDTFHLLTLDDVRDFHHLHRVDFARDFVLYAAHLRVGSLAGDTEEGILGERPRGHSTHLLGHLVLRGIETTRGHGA